jgi:hypothetical protein
MKTEQTIFLGTGEQTRAIVSAELDKIQNQISEVLKSSSIEWAVRKNTSTLECESGAFPHAGIVIAIVACKQKKGG